MTGLRPRAVRILESISLLAPALAVRDRTRFLGDRLRATRARALAPPSLRWIARRDPELRLASVEGVPRLVRSGEDRSFREVADANAAIVEAALERAGLTPEPRHPTGARAATRFQVATDRGAELLRHLAATAPLSAYVQVTARADGAAPARAHGLVVRASAPLLRRPAVVDTITSIAVFEHHADRVGVVADEAAAVVEFVAPVSAERPRLPHALEVTFPVDIVYTWVDGSDPAWLERRAQTFELLGISRSDPDATGASRFEPWDELRYSLRSVERFAPWARHIYLVTDDQRPDWLIDHHPRLTVVDHREIFGDRGSLPTFNSHAIEARLHHIPGLSEHYVYLNDDILFTAPLAPEDFFLANGLSRFYPSRAKVPAGEVDSSLRPVDTAAMNGRDLIAERFGVEITYKLIHAPHPQLRSVLLDIEDWWPDAVERTISSSARSAKDLALASSLHHHVAFLTRRAAPGRIGARYVGTGERRLRALLRAAARDHGARTLCLNDTVVDDHHRARIEPVVRGFLEEQFPAPSSFERRAASGRR